MLVKEFENQDKKFKNESNALKKQETELINQRKTLSADDYKKKVSSLRKKNVEQLSAELMSARETQFGLRIKHKTGQLNEVSDLVKVRKKIAVIKTLINEMKLKDEE